MAATLHDTGCPRTWPRHGWGDLPDCTCASGRYEERSDVMGGTAVILSIFHSIGGDVLFAVERKADGRVAVMTAGQLSP